MNGETKLIIATVY